MAGTMRVFVVFVLVVITCMMVTKVVSANEQRCAAALEEMRIPTNNETLARTVAMRSTNGHGNYVVSPLGIVDIGSWSGCRALENTRYCTVYAGTNETKVGLAACVPHECNATTLANEPRTLVIDALGLHDFRGIPGNLVVQCLERPKLPTAGKWILGVVVLLASAVVVGTLLDLQLNHDMIPIAKWLNRRRGPVYEMPSPTSEIPDYSGEQVWVDPETGRSSGIYGGGVNQPPPTDAELLYLGAEATTVPASRARGKQQAPTALKDTYDFLRNSPVFQLLMAFSFVTNIKRLFARASPGDFAILNGIRVLSLWWVILGHTFVGLGTVPLMNINNMIEVVQRFRFQAVFAAFFAVDSFYVLSGFLVAYLFISQLKKTGIKNSTMPIYYLHRVWRLFPSLALMVLLFWQVVPFIAGNGPIWPLVANGIYDTCSKTWWQTLLFINNFYQQSEVCAGWTWYLANDMQFYFLAPFVLMAYMHHRSVGWTLTSILLLGSWVASLVTTLEYDLQAFPFLNSIGLGDPTLPEPTESVIANVYLLPWTRCSPYLIGFMMAYVLIERGEQVQVPFVIRAIVQVVSAFFVAFLIFITYTEANYGWESRIISVLWLTFSRSLWAAAVGTWILLGIWGYGGAIRKFLSWRLWVPFARLGFGAYLWQSIAIGVFFSSFTFPFDFSADMMLYWWVAMIFVSFCLGLLNYLLLEKPLMNIEKLFLTAFKPTQHH